MLGLMESNQENHPPPTIYSLPVLRKTSLISLHADSIYMVNVKMGEEAQIALSHTQTCVLVLYAKATQAVIKVLLFLLRQVLSLSVHLAARVNC